MDAIECSVCHSQEFREHHLGFLVCEVCGNQARTQVVMMEEEPVKSTPMKRTLRNVTKKAKKEKPQLKVLDGAEYLKTYKKLLDLCVKDMISECGVTGSAADIAAEIWERVCGKQAVFQEVKPKNSTLHLEKRGRSVVALPSDVESELRVIMETYTRRKRGAPYNLKDLLRECERRSLKVQADEDVEARRTEAGLLLVGYTRMCKEREKEELEDEGLEAQILARFDVKRAQPQLLPLSQILPILYLAGYTATSSRAVLLTDILEWTRELRIRYITGHLTLDLQSNYVSLFRPMRVPGEEWLRREVGYLRDKIEFQGRDVPTRAMFERLGSELLLQTKLVRLGELVLERFAEDLAQYKTQRPLELRALAALFIALKLVYGLNGLPYTVLTERTSAQTLEMAARQRDELALLYGDLRPLSELAAVRSTQEWKRKFDTRTNVPWDFADLDTMSAQQEEHYLRWLLASGILLPSATVEMGSLFRHLKHQKSRPNAAPETGLLFPVAELRDQRTNPELAAELEHLQDADAEIPLPCMDWITFQKKSAERSYPSEYVLTLCAFAQLGGRQKLEELHELVDRMERLVARNGEK